MATQNLIDDTIKIYNKYIHPALFTEIKRGPIWPVIAAATVLIIIALEINAVTPSSNINEKNVSDRIDQTLDKLYKNEDVVGWRVSLLVSIVLALIVLFIFYPVLPDGFDFFLITALLFSVIYLGFNWFYWHWHKPTNTRNRDQLLNLRHQVKEMEIKHDINQFKTDDGGYDTVLNRIKSIL